MDDPERRNRLRRAVRDDGEHLDTGGWVRLLEYATGRSARVLGKPSPEFLLAPLEALDRGPETALVVGDDLAADVGGGREVGAATVLVRSGKGDRPQPGPEGRAGRGHRQCRRPAPAARALTAPTRRARTGTGGRSGLSRPRAGRPECCLRTPGTGRMASGSRRHRRPRARDVDG